jgi:hypothetical protein
MPLELAALSIGIVLLPRVGPDIVLNIDHTNVVTAIADTVVGGGVDLINFVSLLLAVSGQLKLRTRWCATRNTEATNDDT